MDIYNLINSKTISDYCRKIKYELNTEEIAVLIFRNNTMSIDEKINAYDEIIKNYPDMEVIERENCKHYDSVNTMIKEEINRLIKLQKLFFKNDDNAIYTYHTFSKDLNRYLKSDNFKYSQTSFKEIERNIYDKYLKDDIDDITKFEIIKKNFKKNYTIVARFQNINNKLVLNDIYDYADLNLDISINNIPLNLPTPFEKGDLIKARK